MKMAIASSGTTLAPILTLALWRGKLSAATLMRVRPEWKPLRSHPHAVLVVAGDDGQAQQAVIEFLRLRAVSHPNHHVTQRLDLHLNRPSPKPTADRIIIFNPATYRSC